MKKKLIAAILTIIAALGTIVGVLLSGYTRPSPEQYLQSIVSQPLPWHKVNGVETASIPARALKFEVGEHYIRVFIEVGKAFSLKNTIGVVNKDIATGEQVVEHYMGWFATSVVGNALAQADQYYTFYGAAPTAQYVQFDRSPNGRIFKLGIDSTIDYILSVSN